MIILLPSPPGIYGMCLDGIVHHIRYYKSLYYTSTSKYHLGSLSHSRFLEFFSDKVNPCHILSFLKSTSVKNTT